MIYNKNKIHRYIKNMYCDLHYYKTKYPSFK